MSAPFVRNDNYEPNKLDAIYQNILVLQGNGRPQDYEIRVDDFPVVGKNNDPSRFMSYADFISPETRYVSVLLYKSNGQSDKYFFHLKPGSFQKAEQLRGLDFPLKNTLSEAELTEKIKKDLHHEELLKENALLKKENNEYETIFKQMEDKMERMKSNRDLKIESVANLLFSGIMKSDFVKEKFPVVENLAGFANNEESEDKGSFKRKHDPDNEVEDVDAEDTTSGISSKERGYLLFIEDIRNRIGDIELANVMHLLDLVAINPHAVAFAIRQVTNFLKNKEKEV